MFFLLTLQPRDLFNIKEVYASTTTTVEQQEAEEAKVVWRKKKQEVSKGKSGVKVKKGVRSKVQKGAKQRLP